MPRAHPTTRRLTHQSRTKKRPTRASQVRMLIASFAPVRGKNEQVEAAMNRILNQTEAFIKKAVLAPDGLGTFKDIPKEIEAIRTLMRGSVYDKALPALAAGLVSALELAAHEDFVMD